MMKTYKILLSFFLILMSGMGFSQSVPFYVPTNGLVGWWGFNGNAQDGSGNGNHGTVTGATLTTDRFGNQNAAYSFNGINNLIELPVNLQGVLTNLNQFSLSAYIRKNNTLSGGDIYGGGIFSNWKAFPLSDPFGMLVKSEVGFGSGNCSGTGVTSRDTLFSDLWYHISVVFNGYQNDALSRMKLYINGNLQFTDSGSTVYSPISVSNSLGNQSTHTAFGAWMSQFGWVGYFNGKIDDIGIWNRALTPQEITNLYNSQLPTQTSLCLPTITTSSPSSVGVDSVVIGGDISNDGGSSIVLRGICYSTSPNPNMGNQRTEDGSGIGSFSTVLRGLTSSTTCYARSYAKNSNGVVVYGNEVSFTTSVSLPGVRCPGTPTVTDIDGNVYNTVQIGNQCWTQSNLKVSKYRNGDSIPTGLSDNTWQNTTSGAYAIYNNDPVNDGLYGKLYNHYAVTDSRGLCPTGWHVPTDGEWNVLVQYLDPNADTEGNGANQSSIAGGALKGTALQPTPGGWNSPNTGATNSSGFTGPPGGFRSNLGFFFDMSSNGCWWSSSVSSASSAWVRTLYYSNSNIYRYNYLFRSLGFSVRCLKNTSPQVNTTSVTNVTPSTALVTGEVITEDDQNTTRGFCYSTTPNPTISNDTTMNGTGLGVYTGTLMNLTPLTTYYVRAYATNSVGTSYGSELSLTTSSITIGSSFAGGIVFYVDGTGQHGLVCAPSDQGSYVWGCDQQFIGGTSSLIGFGLSNTNRINLLCSENQIASRICADLNLNSYSDWYLPSFNELMEIFWTLQGTNGFSNNFYWSSTEDGQGYAKCMYFSHGFAGSTSNAKFVSQRVRAIRSF